MTRTHALQMSVLVQEALQDPDAQVLKVIISDIQNISDLLKAIWLTKYCSIEMEELVVGYGELWYVAGLRNKARSYDSGPHSY